MDPLNVKRRLTCILAADAVGYSKQMSLDEEGTIRILAAHRAVIDGIIAFHQGRIIGTAGDSVLAEFASAVEAVRCAIEMQDAIRTRNDSLPEDRRMIFRVGVNLGDVVVKDNDILGDGVNVAARLESIAEPGGVCISSSVYDQVTGKLNLGFQDIGEQPLKNISRPIRVYRISGTAPASSPAKAAAPVPTVAAARKPAGLVAGGAVALVVVAAIAAWQAGWIGGGSRAAAPKVAAPAAPAVDDAAKRAQAEADAAKIRADAEAIKRQAEADAAKIRADAEAQRAAQTRAEADAAAARTRAQAEADAARIRADARKQATAAAPAVLASASRDAAPQGPSAPAVSAPAAPPATAGSGSNAGHPFDGAWSVTIACAPEKGAQGYRVEVTGTVKDSRMRALRGTEGAPNSLLLEGDIQADGTARFNVSGHTGDPKFTVGNVATSTPYAYTVKAKFDGASGIGVRQELRPCKVHFSKL